MRIEAKKNNPGSLKSDELYSRCNGAEIYRAGAPLSVIGRGSLLQMMVYLLMTVGILLTITDSALAQGQTLPAAPLHEAANTPLPENVENDPKDKGQGAYKADTDPQGEAQEITQEKAHNETISFDPHNLSELIKTLESETARGEFIQNLKTLQKAQDSTAGQAEQAAPLSSLLGFGGAIDGLVGGYRQFLARNNLNSSIIGRIVLSTGALILFYCIGRLVRRLGLAFRNYLLRLKFRYSISHDRYRLYARILRFCGYGIICLFLLYTLGIIWRVSDFGFLRSGVITQLIGNFLSALLIIVLAIVFWEIISGSIEHGMRHANSRLRTLLPIVRNIAFVTFSILFILILLSELGINIMPLLAGAGIFGIAIGFGAQTIVKDFLTGFIIILEDLIQVGDVAGVGGRSGLVEKITIRKVQLRDLSGTVFTVPFSEISVVDNLTKEFSFYLMDVGVAYRENTDEVISCLREIDEQMRQEDKFKDLILEPIEILGVDQFADSAVIIKARIKTRPIKQWEVGREFNRRMKMLFDERGIEIPFPHQTLYFGQDKSGNAPPAPILMKKVQEVEDSPDPISCDRTEDEGTVRAADREEHAITDEPGRAEKDNKAKARSRKDVKKGAAGGAGREEDKNRPPQAD